ncbi:hypothetical protein GLOIN_2v1784794 [Rhizophagus clarus]|uniref:F-box domain-containing protein n=1 Tax=Rhizophagus clarus TaxID=94130 RepID=A0A8H3R055_9GLOM|nr:hypothetical protein GLOIN_2v1784794 [Rhizophagus clarus]
MAQLIEDCLRIIFTELKNDSNSLYSCVLVNRYWCRIAIPILWKNPYNHKNISNKNKFYYTIINLLPTSSKQYLLDNNIDLPFITLSNQPLLLFNYISFSSQISSKFINNITKSLLKNEFDLDKYKKLENEIYKLFINNCKFIKDFCWETTQSLHKYSGASTCFSQLCVLTIDLQFVNSEALFGMSKICQNIEDLKVHYYSSKRDSLGLIKFLDIQRNLQSLYLHFKIKSVRKQSIQLSEVIKRKSVTLKKLIIGPTITLISPEFLPSLINLQHLEFTNSMYMSKKEIVEMQEWENYLSISSLPNLRYIKTGLCLPLRNDYKLIENSHGNIREINICRRRFNNKRDPLHSEKLIEVIPKHCPKVESLTIDAELKNLSGIREILLNCSQLKKIKLSSCNNKWRLIICDELLDILIKFSQNNLYSFSFNRWKFSVDGLKSFFENWRNKHPIIFNLYPDLGSFTIEHQVVMKKYVDEGYITSKLFLMFHAT